MSRSTFHRCRPSLRRLVGAGLLGLVLTGCPTPATHVEIDVGPGDVLAADVLPGQFDYWILDSNGAVVEDGQLTITGAGSVTIHADLAAGFYVTTPDYATAPGYSVAFDGETDPTAVFSYLDTDESAFDDLRGGDPSTMAARHDELVTMGDTVRTEWQLSRTAQADNLVTAAHDAVTGALSEMQDGMSLLLDGSDLDAAEAGTLGLASWATDVQDEMDLIEPLAQADAALADSETAALEASAPDPAVLQQAIEACLELEAWGDELEAALDQAFPDKEGDDYDGKNEKGELDRDWAELEAQLEAGLLVQEETALDIELCVELAIGGEPTVSYTETDPSSYEAIGDNASDLAADAAAGVDTFEDGLETTYGGDELAYYGVSGWYAPAQQAMDTIVAEIGEDMFGTTGGSTTPGFSSSTMKSDSSPNACDNTTPVFQIDLLGIGLVIGTPFDDTIRGGDVEASFEVLWGGQGDDCINGRKGHEILLGGSGNDELHGGDQHELIVGGEGDDLLYAGYGEDYSFTVGAVTVEVELGSVLFGGSGDDVLSGSDPDYDESDASDFGYTDLLFGDGLTASSAGEDTIDGGGGIDLIFGQWDDDILRNRRQGRIIIDGVDLEVGSFHFGGDGDDDLTGSDKLDLLIGSDGDDTITAHAGLDIVLAGAGDDEVDGGDGLDLIFTSDGDDNPVTGGDGVDLVVGGSGDDVVSGGDGLLDLVFGGSGDDTVDGEGGFDILFGGSDQDVVNGGDGLDLLFGGSDNDTVMGGEGIDLAFGGTGRDRVEGGDGAVDLLFGNDETDIVIGGAGLDVMFGNDGDDWMDGEDGVDLAWAGEGDDVLFGGNDLDILFGSEGDDCLWGEQGVDLGFGGDGDDQLVGGTELDLLVGSGGDDLVRGEGGIDFLLGGAGEDALSSGTELGLLFGGDDDDTLEGGTEMDLLFGNDGADCHAGEDGFDIVLGGDGDDVARSVGVGIGSAGRDEIETSLVGLGGGDDDMVAQIGTTMAFLTGGDGDDELSVDEAGGIAFVFGGSDDDTLSATGKSPTSGSYSRAFVFGGSGGDWLQASRGKSFAFGQSGDDILSPEADGTSSNDDHKDRHWGNSDSDAMYGDDSDNKDKMYRGSGSDPSRTWDDWPSTSPGWSSAHAAMSFTTCPTVPTPTECEEQMEPPHDVGAK